MRATPKNIHRESESAKQSSDNGCVFRLAVVRSSHNGQFLGGDGEAFGRTGTQHGYGLERFGCRAEETKPVRITYGSHDLSGGGRCHDSASVTRLNG
jgi:hypothetical protein